MLSFFCPCPKGLEQVLHQEIIKLAQEPKYNIISIKVMSGGVSFKGDMMSCYAVNLFSRIASRVLLYVNSSPYNTEDDIYYFTKKQQWDSYFSHKQTLRLDINASNSPVKSLNFVNLRVKDGICDAFRAKTGLRPSIDTENPQVRIMTFLNKNLCHLYIDTSGEALFRRGWRQEIGEAPIKENLAAGILYLSNWQAGTPLIDPMCGSGTFLIEAMHMALNVPPGANRDFAFENLKIHKPTLWQQLKVFANKQRQISMHTNLDYILGSDISERMLVLAKENAKRANVNLNLQLADVRNIKKTSEKGILIVNPPYGERISVRGVAPKVFIRGQTPKLTETDKVQKAEETSQKEKDFYIEWASNLKQNFSNWQIYILSGDLELPTHMRLKPRKKIPLYNGNLDCRLFVFDMVSGSMR